MIFDASSVIPLTVGFDEREAVAYHVFCQSVIEKSSVPVQFIPLAQNNLCFYQEIHKDGSNKFVYSRFLTPFILGYKGWAIFADGDMVCNADIHELWSLRDPSKAVQVVKHEYKTKSLIKYLNNKNVDYPRKNWSSLVLWNCGHEANKVLTPEFISQKPGSYLHRFLWLEEGLIGSLPMEWNWLAVEYEKNPEAKIVHYTLGTPCFKDYSNCSMSEYWHESLMTLKQGIE